MVLENVYTGRRNEEDGTHRICGIFISTLPGVQSMDFFKEMKINNFTFSLLDCTN